DQGRAAEDVGIDDCQDAKRSGFAPWQSADDRDRECQDQHQDLGRHHQLQVQLEALPHVLECYPERVRREELLQNLMHLGLLRDYLRTGIFEKSMLNHFFCSFAIVPLLQSLLICAFTSGSSFEPFWSTAPYCSCVTIWPPTAP